MHRRALLDAAVLVAVGEVGHAPTLIEVVLSGLIGRLLQHALARRLA